MSTHNMFLSKNKKKCQNVWLKKKQQQKTNFSRAIITDQKIFASIFEIGLLLMERICFLFNPCPAE